MIAERMGVELATLEVKVQARADVRGCLMVDPDVPAGFQGIETAVRINAAIGTDPAQVRTLTAAAERCFIPCAAAFRCKQRSASQLSGRPLDSSQR